MKKDYFSELKQLIACNTTSPMPISAVDAADRLLAEFGFIRAHGICWYRGDSSSSTCVYSHIDTKPPEPISEWETDPYELVCRNGRMIGLGVADAKFQVLNALNVFEEREYFFVIDGAEEIGGVDAAHLIRDMNVKNLIIVDGGRENESTERMFSGTKGQIDGWIRYCSGERPKHPGRSRKSGSLAWLGKLYEDVVSTNMHFNMTGIMSPPTVRSLTVEEIELRFDVRYSHEDEQNISKFIRNYAPHIKQNYHPLLGVQTKYELPIASFSSPLGNVLKNIEHLLVLPGALSENGSHRPNEWIHEWQIEEHQKLLREALDVIDRWN